MKKLSLLLLYLSLSLVTWAQEATEDSSALTFPPENLNSYFTDSVEINSIQIIDEYETIAAPAFQAYVDMEMRLFVYAEGQSVPFPAEWEGIIYSEIRGETNGWLFIQVQKSDSSNQLWRYDSLNNRFDRPDDDERFDTPCGLQAYQTINFSTQEWFFSETDGRNYLCNFQSGTLPSPLAAEYDYRNSYGYGWYDIAPQLSPNGSRIAFIGMPAREAYLEDNRSHLFIYDLRIDTVQDVGWIYMHQDTDIFWINEEIVAATGHEVSGTGYAYFDFTFDIFHLSHQTEEHLGPHGSDYWQDSGYIRRGDGLQFISYYPNDENCYYEIYDIETDSTTRYDYGQLCYLESGAVFGDGYYIGLDGFLYAYNPINDEQRLLYDDARVSELLWIKEEYGMAAMMIEHSEWGRYVLPTDGARSGQGAGHQVLIDLNTSQVLFQSDVEWDGWGMGWLPYDQLLPFDANHWLVRRGIQTELFTRTPGGIQTIMLEGILSPINERWGLQLESLEYYKLGTVGLYELETGTYIQLFDLSPLSSGYQGRLQALPDGGYELRLHYLGSEAAHHQLVIVNLRFVLPTA